VRSDVRVARLTESHPYPDFERDAANNDFMGLGVSDSVEEGQARGCDDPPGEGCLLYNERLGPVSRGGKRRHNASTSTISFLDT